MESYRVADHPRRPEADVVELSLLFTSSQAEALERAAHQHGLTVAQMVRGVMGDFLELTRVCAAPADLRVGSPFTDNDDDERQPSFT